jgi:FkbM family methyltransferase
MSSDARMSSKQRIVFDIGMYDCADTQYYLEMGYRVVAVEANPLFARRAAERFSSQIAAGQFTCINAAISSQPGTLELVLSGDDLGASSVFGDRIADRQPIGSVSVRGITVRELFETHGVPHYMKVDIEGSDRLAVLGLTVDACPRYLSFEIGDDVDELVQHARSIGYDRFKIVNQISFRELANESSLRDRIVHRLAERMGYAEPRLIRRAGRFFVSGRSSGPAPWLGDGRWYSADETMSRWRVAKSGPRSAWYDVHATRAER